MMGFSVIKESLEEDEGVWNHINSMNEDEDDWKLKSHIYIILKFNKNLKK